jgi:hypothetical protein
MQIKGNFGPRAAIPNRIDRSPELSEISRVNAIASRTQTETITPQSHYHGPVAQLINSRYLFELQKQVKRILKGRKLKEFLNYDYSDEEFESLPPSLKTLLNFDRNITTAEILQFMEALDDSHEITFRDYSFDRIKFRALFEALGTLIDVEMQAGPSTFVSLSDSFEIKKKIKEFFNHERDRKKNISLNTSSRKEI